MSREDIIEQINTIFIDEFEVDAEDLIEGAILKDTLELDSLDYVDLVVSIESSFSIKLVAEDFEGIDTLQSFYDLLDKKVNG